MSDSCKWAYTWKLARIALSQKYVQKSCLENVIRHFRKFALYSIDILNLLNLKKSKKCQIKAHLPHNLELFPPNMKQQWTLSFYQINNFLPFCHALQFKDPSKRVLPVVFDLLAICTNRSMWKVFREWFWSQRGRQLGNGCRRRWLEKKIRLFLAVANFQIKL